MENTITTLILVHAGFGAISLTAGFLSIVAKKGRKLHKISGNIFYYAMLISALTAMLVAISPNHENPFLFSIGIFSSYFVLTGYRALRYKNKNPNLFADKCISVIMLVTGIAMIGIPLLLSGSMNIVLSVFGLMGIFFSLRDHFLYQNPSLLKSKWLKLHIGRITGGYISAVTAFIVVNEYLPSLYGWFVPGVIGGIYIFFWMWKIKIKPNIK